MNPKKKSGKRAWLAVVIPFLVSLVVGYLLLHLTGRDRFVRSCDPASVPLNERVMGYGPYEVEAYWKWLDTSGRVVERRFLWWDLGYPFVYCGGLLVGLGLLRRLRFATILPVAITAFSDWTENIVHLSQLRRFETATGLEEAWISVASLATTFKWMALGISVIVLIAAAVQAMRERPPGHTGD